MPTGIDATLKKLKPKKPQDVSDQWAALDKKLIQSGDIAVYGSELSSSFFSDRMNFKDCAGVHPVYKNDWALFCLK